VEFVNSYNLNLDDGDNRIEQQPFSQQLCEDDDDGDDKVTGR